MNSRTPKIRTVASLLRKNTSTFPAPRFGRLHYRGLEKCKTITLCKSNGNFNARTHLTEAARSDIRWRKEKIWQKYNHIIVPNPDKCIATDASSYGWGAVMESQSTGDRFSTFIWNEGTYQCATAESNIIWFETFRKRSNKSLYKSVDWQLNGSCMHKELWHRQITRMQFRNKRYMTSGLWFFYMVACSTFTRNAKYGSRLGISETQNTHWMEIEQAVFHFMCGELEFFQL